MNRLIITLSIACVVPATFATNIIPSNSNAYYSLNGGSNLVMPPVTTSRRITIGGDANTNLGYSCDNFNPAVSLSHAFDDMGANVEGISNDIVESATTALGSLPMYLLQKASPELYSIINNTLFDAKDTFNTSIKSCQQSLNDIKQGGSPYQDWFNISDSRGWVYYASSAAQGNDININTAKTEIAKDPKKYGVPWIHHGASSGGTQDGQVPINVISDVVLAGYNVLASEDGSATRALDDTSSPAPTDSALYTLFNTPQDAAEFSDMVIGDIIISGHEEEQSTQAGIGLATMLESCPQGEDANLCPQDIQSKLTELVRSKDEPSAEDLNQISASNMVVSPTLITSIQNLDNQEQAYAISKLSDDIAMQNIISKTLMLRRLLLAGEKIKAVQSNTTALKEIVTVINQLNQEIQNLVFESDVRKKLTANTAQTLLMMNNQKNRTAATEHEQSQALISEHGAIYKNGGEQIL